MSKELAKLEQPIGSDGGKVVGMVSVDEQFITAEVKVQYPTAKIIEPAMAGIDHFADKIEALIPGDQKELAAQAKKEAREFVLNYIKQQTQAAS